LFGVHSNPQKGRDGGKKKNLKKAKNNYHHHAVPTYRMIPYCVSPPIHTCNGKSRRKNRGTFGACQTVMMPVGYPRSRVQASKSERKKRQARSSQATPTFHSFLPWKCAKHNYSSTARTRRSPAPPHTPASEKNCGTSVRESEEKKMVQVRFKLGTDRQPWSALALFGISGIKMVRRVGSRGFFHPFSFSRSVLLNLPESRLNLSGGYAARCP